MAQAKKQVAVSKAVEATAQNDNAGRNEQKVITCPEVVTVSIEEFRKRFKFYKHNRGTGTDEKRAREIAKSIAFKGTGWLLNDVIVDKATGTIIDGNTSGLARIIAHDEYGVDMQVRVRLVELPDGLEVWKAASEFNTHSKQWNLNNFVWNHINEGHQNYIRIKDLCDKLGGLFIKNGTTYEWSYAGTLCGREVKQEMREGKFELRDRDFGKRLAFGKEVNAIWEKGGRPNQGSWAEPFIVSLYKFKTEYPKAYKLDHILANVKSSDFDGSQSQQVWRERIYNWSK